MISRKQRPSAAMLNFGVVKLGHFMREEVKTVCVDQVISIEASFDF